MMIVVAILAIYLGAATEWSRREREGIFQSKARMHADLEKRFREEEREDISTVTDWEKKGWDGSLHRKFAARDAARADYHAAMKRKYEEAASRAGSSLNPTRPSRRDS